MKYLLAFLIYLLTSGKQNKALSQQFTLVFPKNIDTAGFKKYQWKFNANLRLNDISNGVDSFEVRIEYNLSLVVQKDLFIIRYTKGNWKGLHYAYQYKKGSDSLDFVQKEFTPLISWGKLIDSIYNNPTLRIPSQVDLKNYRNRVADGKYFTMEYATKYKFKTISYENPEYYPEFKESKIVLDFIDMLYRNISSKELCWPQVCK